MMDQKIKNDFLPGDDFVSCISEWRLPSLHGSGAAELTYKHSEGWTVMTISGKNFRREVRYNQ